MAGIGVKLNRIFGKNTLGFDLIGFGYSTLITIMPMVCVIANILLMGKVLELSKTAYLSREIFFCIILYIFIFSLITTAPLNAVLSRYMSDVIYEERYEDIIPCFYLGLLMNVILSCLLGIPFSIYTVVVGNLSIFHAFTGFCGYISLVLVFYSMLYLSICKDYKKISIFFLSGMAAAFFLSMFFVYVCSLSATDAMLLALAIGFLVIACEEIALVKRYFKENSGRYRQVLSHIKKYWKLVVVNTFYILGLYVHNFVFWATDLKIVVVKSFVCAPSYDLASSVAMFTNISATVIFIAKVEMNFHEKYKGYSEAVIGGRGLDIRYAQNRMFRQLSLELVNLARIQFIISVVVFLICVVILPQHGFSGLVMQIYPCLAAGYFILFLMYSAIIFLYYYNDLSGALYTTAAFLAITFAGSILAAHLPVKWYGIGLVAGSLVGWTIAYYRLRWVERHLDVHIFCSGALLKRGKGDELSSKVYNAPTRGRKERKENWE